jgi:hypothetical protein
MKKEDEVVSRSQPCGEASADAEVFAGMGAENSAQDDPWFIAQGRKQQAARLAGDAFTDWLLALAKIAQPKNPAAWLVGSVVLNEECWFDYFADGYTPASCWAEECSYD